MSNEQLIAVEAGALAATMPFALLEPLARSIGRCPVGDWALARPRILHGIAHPHYRGLATAFLDRWQAQAADVAPQSVGLALLTAGHAEKAYNDRQSIELVWTGPASEVAPFRRTEQAILQVLDSAAQRITLVSYAVYRIPFICDALVRAAARGVGISVIVETPDRIVGETEYNTLKALGSEVAGCCSVYYWPKDKRPQSEGGKVGLLHVKCAVADGQVLLLSSANLTQQAFTLNMELGLLVRGGILPGQVEEHFQRLIQMGTLVRV